MNEEIWYNSEHNLIGIVCASIRFPSDKKIVYNVPFSLDEQCMFLERRWRTELKKCGWERIGEL